MAASLKLNDIRSVIKMGAFLISVEENEMKGLGEGWPRKFRDVLLTELVCVKSSLQKFNRITEGATQ
jgi:hypothetical protein